MSKRVMDKKKSTERFNRLVQLDIDNPMKACDRFNEKPVDGQIPLVLVPKYPKFFHWFLQIPSGVWILQQKWNAHCGMMDPGLKLFWPGWYRVSHIVTKQAVAYSNPVRFCPTSDNVMVDIDISISFQIGPTAEDVTKFVYHLGAHRLDEFLYTLSEEAIRGLVNSVRYDQVHDLREEFAVGMKRDLNAKLLTYGVFINNVKVTNVELPEALSKTLEETTAFKTRMEEQEKNHENQMRILVNEETQKLTALQKENDRRIQDLLAVKARTIIQRDEKRTVAEAKAQVSIAKFTAENANRIAEAKGLKIDAVSTATATSVSRKAQPAVELCQVEKTYQSYIEVANITKEAKISAAEKEASKIRSTADAEGLSSSLLVEKRAFEYQMRKLSVESGLARALPMVISGKNGDDLIRNVVLQSLDTKM